MKPLGRGILTKITDRLFPGGSRYLVLFVHIFRICHLKRQDWAYKIIKHLYLCWKRWHAYKVRADGGGRADD